MLKTTWKKTSTLALVLLLTVALLPVNAHAEDIGPNPIDVSTLTGDFQYDNWDYNEMANTLTIRTNGIILTGSKDGLMVNVSDSVTNLTLNGVTFSHLRKNSGDLAVTLAANTTSSLANLAGNASWAGIYLPAGKLTLTGCGVFNISSNDIGIDAKKGITITGNTTVNAAANTSNNAFGHAVRTDGDLAVEAGGSLVAQGGDSTGQHVGGSGISVGGRIINSGAITAIGGASDGGCGGAGAVADGGIINTGKLTATGGKSNHANDAAPGVRVAGDILNSGTLTATGGENTAGPGGYGIDSVAQDMVTLTNSGTLNTTGGIGTPNGLPINLSKITVINDALASDADFTLDFTTRTLTHPTGVIVSGDGIANISRLIVQPNKLHAEGGCAACDEIRRRSPLAVYDIALNSGHRGSVDVFIPLSSGVVGATYTVLHCNKGVLEEQTATCQNGGVTTTWKKLSPFAVVQDVNVSVPENTVVDPPKTGSAPTGGMAGMALVLCALVLCVVVQKKRSTNS